MIERQHRRMPGTAVIRGLASPESYERGEDYRRDGAVSDLVARGDAISAAVQGSEAEPYRVALRIEGGRVGAWSCTCPYDWGGACKHVVAALLVLADDPEAASVRPTLAKLLEPLDRAGLLGLILKRADQDADLAGWIEAEIAVMVRPGKRGPVDTEPVAAQARAVLSGRAKRRDYWDGYRASGNAEELHALARNAVPHMEAGDGASALRILEAVAGPLVEDWLDRGYESDEEFCLLFHDLGRMMAEAALLCDLPAAERDGLAATLEEWDSGLEEYGVEEGFAVAVRALETGWNEPALLAVLDGGPGPWPPEEEEDLAELALTEIRLRVLDAAERHDAYLNLARAAGAQARVAAMLARLGRIDEAMAHAEAYFTLPDESLSLATALAEAGRMDEAFRAAEAGLRIGAERHGDPWEPGRSVAPLALWLREAASKAGRRDLALIAARIAFEHSLSREDFQEARKAAGEDWDGVRRDLLARLIAARHAHDRTDILLDEDMVDEAVSCAGKAPGHEVPDTALLRLMDAAHASHPDWVIRVAEGRACAIMDGGSSGLYGQAAEWLKRAATAYDAAGRIDAWDARIEGLIETHRRKYKLRPLLEGLRYEG